MRSPGESPDRTGPEWTFSPAALKPEAAAALEPARGRDVALLISSEYEGLYKNGGIGTYFREANRVLCGGGWFTILVNLNEVKASKEQAASHGLNAIFNFIEVEQALHLNPVHQLLLDSSRSSFYAYRAMVCLLLIEAVARALQGQRVYAEFHDFGGVGYLAAKAKESGFLGPEVVVAVTTHGPQEWVDEASGALIGRPGGSFGREAAREEHSFQYADLAMFPSDSLHQIVGSYGWRTGHAIKIPYVIPRHSLASMRCAKTGRTMMIVCAGGLSNRLMTLVTGYWLARFFGLQPVISWHPDRFCDCRLERLFTPPRDVQVTQTHPWEPEMQEVLSQHTIISHLPIPNWPAHGNPKQISDQGHLWNLFGSGGGPVLYFDNYLAPWLDPAPQLELFDRDFRLEAGIDGEVNTFALIHNLPQCAAAHLRLTDFGREPDFYLPAVQEATRKHPGEPVFLCTDSREAEEHYLRAFPQLFIRPKQAYVTKHDPSLAWLNEGQELHHNVQRSETAVVDGLIDFLLLAEARQAYSRDASTFFQFARHWHDALRAKRAGEPRNRLPDHELLDQRHFRFPVPESKNQNRTTDCPSTIA
jgi:hypothetical protein